MRALSLVLVLLVSTACDESVTGPTVPVNTQFTLAPSETASVFDTGIRVQFNGVDGDSRCPADAICVQGGDALVRISVLSGSGRSDYDLHTGSMAPVHHDTFIISLVELAPYPFSSGPIEPGDYRATLQVTR